jgi:hypothetical protein
VSTSKWYELNPTRRRVLGWCAGWLISTAGAAAIFKWSAPKRWHVTQEEPAGLPLAARIVRSERHVKGKEERKKIHAIRGHGCTSMVVSNSGVVHWPNVLLFKTRYDFKTVEEFCPDEWKEKMGLGGSGRRTPRRTRKRVPPPQTLHGNQSVVSSSHYFMGYREDSIRETLALAILTIDKTQGWVKFGNLEAAIAILTPGLTSGRRGERNRMLFARLVALDQEAQALEAMKTISKTLGSLPDPGRQDQIKWRSNNTREVEGLAFNSHFKKWHSKTVDRRARANTFRSKLARRVEYAKGAMHAAPCEMGACSSNGQDTRLRDMGSTPLQTPMQYRHRSYFGRLRRRWRRWLKRKLSPRPSRAARHESSRATPGL